MSKIDQFQIHNRATIDPGTLMVETSKLIPDIVGAKIEGFETQQKGIAKVAQALSAAKPLAGR